LRFGDEGGAESEPPDADVTEEEEDVNEEVISEVVFLDAGRDNDSFKDDGLIILLALLGGLESPLSYMSAIVPVAPDVGSVESKGIADVSLGDRMDDRLINFFLGGSFGGSLPSFFLCVAAGPSSDGARTILSSALWPSPILEALRDVLTKQALAAIRDCGAQHAKAGDFQLGARPSCEGLIELRIQP